MISPEAGGYEPLKQSYRSRGTFALVGATVDELFKLRERMFPEDCTDADPYPDNLTQPIVNIPEAVKYRKVNWQFESAYFFGGVCKYLSPEVGAFVTQAGMIALGWLLLYWLYRRDIFLRV